MLSLACTKAFLRKVADSLSQKLNMQAAGEQVVVDTFKLLNFQLIWIVVTLPNTLVLCLPQMPIPFAVLHAADRKGKNSTPHHAYSLSVIQKFCSLYNASHAASGTYPLFELLNLVSRKIKKIMFLHVFGNRHYNCAAMLSQELCKDIPGMESKCCCESLSLF